MTTFFPSGGPAALVAGALLSLVNGMLYAWSAFVLPVEQATGWTRPQTSLVFTFALVFFGLGMMSGGRFIRRFGPRATAAGGGIMLAAGLATSSWATSPWHLTLSYGVLAGYGIGVANIVPTAVVLGWYPEKRGLVCGVMAFSLAAGTLLFGAGLAGNMIDVRGYAFTLRCLSALALLLALPASVFLRLPSNRGSTRPGQEARNNGLSTPQMLRTPRFRRAWAWTCAVQTGGLMMMGHVVPYAMEQGATAAQAGAAMGVYAAANGAGRLLFGMLYDARGARFAMLADALCLTGSLLLLAVLPPVAGYAGLLPAAAGIALAFGGSIPLFSAFIAQNFGPAHLETNIGMTATVFLCAGFAGPYLGGCLHAATGGYVPALLAAAVIGLAGIPAAIGLKREP